MKEKPVIALPYASAVIVAAGNSTRMGEGVNKQFLPICGTPVIARTAQAFDRSELVREVVIVARDQDMIPFWDIMKYFNIQKVKNIVTGGDTRQQSVLNGIRHLSTETAYYVVHDGARPLISPFTIDKVICDAFHHGAAAVGTKVKDTLKQVGENGFIECTPDREKIYHIQTPQVFERDLYLQAVARTMEEGGDYTDDCQMLERAGVPIFVTQGEYANIKITTKEDAALAESLLMQQE